MESVTRPGRRCGRFAPSPTGPLHFGSLVAAVASFLDARAAGGTWHVRIDDLDPPREVPGAATQILEDLERLGLTWDGEVVFQSRRDAAYEAACRELELTDLAFPCACTRREIGPGPYPGTCADGLPPGRTGRSLRARCRNATIVFEDRIQGTQTFRLGKTEGDFVIRRADGLYGYHLACVLDDAALGVTDVVRGADLLASTANQRHLAELLALPVPTHAHVPVALDAAGEKLSKHSQATAIGELGLSTALWQALEFLGQDPPEHARGAPCRELIDWAIARFRLEDIPKVLARPCDH